MGFWSLLLVDISYAPRRRRPRPTAPRRPVECRPSANLQSLEQQVEHIQDQVARSALQEKSGPARAAGHGPSHPVHCRIWGRVGGQNLHY